MSKKQTVSTTEIRKIAQLAKLRLEDEQCALYTQQINAILEHVRTLEKVDVSEVEPLSHVLELVNVSRDDQPSPSLPREKVLSNAPAPTDANQSGPSATDGEFFLVPGVLKTG